MRSSQKRRNPPGWLMRAIIHLAVISILFLGVLNPRWFWQSNNGKKIHWKYNKSCFLFFHFWYKHPHEDTSYSEYSSLDYINIHTNHAQMLRILYKSKQNTDFIWSLIYCKVMPFLHGYKLYLILSIPRLLTKVECFSKLHSVGLFSCSKL